MIGATLPNGTQGVIGVVDDVTLYDTALTEDEIKSIMDFGLAGKYKIYAVNPRGKLATGWGQIKSRY